MSTRDRTAIGLLMALNLLTIGKQLLPIGNWSLLLWMAAAVPYFVFPRARPRVPRRTQDELLIYTIAFLAIYLTVWWLTGYIDSFGRSPYDRSLPGLAGNLIFLGGPIVAQEITRTFLAGSGKRNNRWFPVLAGVTLFLCGLRFNMLADNLTSVSKAIPYVFGTLVPAIIQALLLTWLVWTCGLFPALLFRFLPEAVQWVLPNLPKTGWLLKMMVGVVVPLFTILALQQAATPKVKKHRSSGRWMQSGRVRPVIWSMLLMILAAMFSFTLGLLPYKPIVIATNSMLPVIRAGDVIVIEPPKPDSLKVGDVVSYRLGEYNIVHRIEEVTIVGNQQQFIFKGDNNDSADMLPVAPEQIMGKVVYVIPYVGLVSLAIRSMDNPSTVPVDVGKN